MGAPKGAELRAFLHRARAAGAIRIELRGPDAQPLFQGELTEANESDLATEIESACETYASEWAEGSDHRFELTAQAVGSWGKSTHLIYVRGTKKSAREHVVDAEKIRDAPAALGHLVRALVDSAKQNVALSALALEEARNARQEAREMWVRVQEKHDEYELAKLGLQIEQEKSSKQLEVAKDAVKQLPAALSVVFAKKRAAPSDGGDQAALCEWRERMTQDEHVAIQDILGEEVWLAIMSAATPRKVAHALVRLPNLQQRLMTLAAKIGPQRMQAIAVILKPVLDDEREKYDKEKSNVPSQTAAQ